MTNVIIEFDGITEELQNTVERAVANALLHEGAEGGINVVLTGDEEIREFNRSFRGIDSVTDVLSFPANEGEAFMGIPDDFLGDIVISCARAFLQAAEYGHSAERELAFLAVHGTLHILGYDHMTQSDADGMFALQNEILEDMGLKR